MNDLGSLGKESASPHTYEMATNIFPVAPVVELPRPREGAFRGWNACWNKIQCLGTGDAGCITDSQLETLSVCEGKRNLPKILGIRVAKTATTVAHRIFRPTSTFTIMRLSPLTSNGDTAFECFKVRPFSSSS